MFDGDAAVPPGGGATSPWRRRGHAPAPGRDPAAALAPRAGRRRRPDLYGNTGVAHHRRAARAGHGHRVAGRQDVRERRDTPRRCAPRRRRRTAAHRPRAARHGRAQHRRHRHPGGRRPPGHRHPAGRGPRRPGGHRDTSRETLAGLRRTVGRAGRGPGAPASPTSKHSRRCGCTSTCGGRAAGRCPPTSTCRPTGWCRRRSPTWSATRAPGVPGGDRLPERADRGGRRRRRRQLPARQSRPRSPTAHTRRHRRRSGRHGFAGRPRRASRAPRQRDAELPAHTPTVSDHPARAAQTPIDTCQRHARGARRAAHHPGRLHNDRPGSPGSLDQSTPPPADAAGPRGPSTARPHGRRARSPGTASPACASGSACCAATSPPGRAPRAASGSARLPAARRARDDRPRRARRRPAAGPRRPADAHRRHRPTWRSSARPEPAPRRSGWPGSCAPTSW